MKRQMLLLLEAPFISGDRGEAIWVNTEASYFKSRTYTYDHKYLPYAAAIVIDCTERKVVNIRKHIVGIYTKLLPQELIDTLVDRSIQFDLRDKTWVYRLQPERNSDGAFSNINPSAPARSKLFEEFLESTVSKGIPSTGLRGNVNTKNDSQDNPDDESCETC